MLDKVENFILVCSDNLSTGTTSVVSVTVEQISENKFRGYEIAYESSVALIDFPDVYFYTCVWDITKLSDDGDNFDYDVDGDSESYNVYKEQLDQAVADSIYDLLIEKFENQPDEYESINDLVAIDKIADKYLKSELQNYVSANSLPNCEGENGNDGKEVDSNRLR